MAINIFEENEIVSRTNVNSRINGINNMFPVSIENGGTGATSIAGAKSALGIMEHEVLYDWDDFDHSYMSTLPLTHDYQNYDFIYIQYDDGYDAVSSTTFIPYTVPSATLEQELINEVNLMIVYRGSSYSGMYLRSALLKFEEDHAELYRAGTLSMPDSGNNTWTIGDNYFYIHKIIGYNY